MSAIAILSQYRKPLSSMSDTELDDELTFWNQELVCRNRWGDTTEVALQAIEEIHAERLKRALAVIRTGKTPSHLRLIKPEAERPIEVRVMGAGKSRAEYRPSRRSLIGAATILLAVLIGATAIAGQRAVELNEQYAREIV